MDLMNVLYAVLVLSVMGCVFGLVLAIASKVFAVEVDPRVEEIAAVLPGANCGGCGFAGCAACAKAMAEGKAPLNACAAGGAAAAEQIAKIMGATVEATERKVAFVACNGGLQANTKYDYVGVKDCVAAMKVANGPLDCRFGCLGFGTCVAACKFGALSISPNGVAVVDEEKCTNCGACRKACPRQIIHEKPYGADTLARCSSQEKGVVAKKECAVACIGCKLCEKTCEDGAITVVNNVAIIDYSKCTSCGKCVAKCPRKVLYSISGKVAVVDAAPKAAAAKAE